MLQILIQGQKVTKSEQWPKCHKFWSKDKKLQNLNNDHNFHVCSKVNSYKFWTMTKKLHILIKGQKVTKSEQWPKCHKFTSKVKKLQNLNNIQNVTNYDQRSKSYKIWTITKKLQVLMKGKKLQILNNAKNLHILIKGQQVTKSEQCLKCCKFW